MWLAGISVADPVVLDLVGRLREAELDRPADHLERTLARGARIVALDVEDREAILQVLDDCPDALHELRSVLVDERLWRARDALR